MSKHFIILGLPRSMTAWTSCFLTCGDVFCLHEHTGAKETAEAIRFSKYSYTGICCPASLVEWEELVRLLPDAKTVFIHRPIGESRASLAKVAEVPESLMADGYSVLATKIQGFIQYCEPNIIDVEELRTPDGARRLWNWVAPEANLSELHLRKMLSLHIEQHPALIRESAHRSYDQILAR